MLAGVVATNHGRPDVAEGGEDEGVRDAVADSSGRGQGCAGSGIGDIGLVGLSNVEDLEVRFMHEIPLAHPVYLTSPFHPLSEKYIYREVQSHSANVV